jgi:hypothetical protein
MKKTGLLLALCLLVVAASAQQKAAVDQPTPAGTVATNVNFPIERMETPTRSDLYCAGFVNRGLLPDAAFVAGGLYTPNTTQFSDGELIYLTGKAYELGKRYRVVRELRDPNRRELFEGQLTMLKAMGQP